MLSQGVTFLIVSVFSCSLRCPEALLFDNFLMIVCAFLVADFDDFYPSTDGKIKKKIVLKVSDYRSAIIQGKFLAKKGLWVSEYRIESGLNCGGHAFATDGLLMGPILSEFRENRNNLVDETFDILTAALTKLNKKVPVQKLPIKITAQGGVGTSDEQDFLINH